MQQNAVVDRYVCRHEHVGRTHHAVVGLNATRVALVHADDPGVFVHGQALRNRLFQQSVQIRRRVELALVLPADRAAGPERQGHLVNPFDAAAGAP